MNSSNLGDDELTSTLARQAERYSSRAADLSMEQVMSRAGEIRRGRRMRATMVMAAVVLAVAVPVGITVLDQDPTKRPPITDRGDDSSIALDGLDTGKPPATGWYGAGELHGLDSTLPIEQGSQISYLARLDDAFLVGRYDEESQEMIASVLDAGGNNRQTWPLASNFAVSGDGRTGAFVQPDGQVTAVESDGGYVDLGTVPGGGGSDYKALSVEGDCASSCSVIVSSSATPQVWIVDKNNTGTEVDTGLQSPTDVFGSRYAGLSRINEDMSTCSAVTENAIPLWSTCPGGATSGKRLGAFSPDGQHLLGTYTIGSGEGDSEFAILDAATGEVLLDLETDGQGTENQGVIRQVMWEDESHVLALVREGADFAVIRFGLRGEREYALPPEPGIDYDTAPFKLPVG